MSRQVSKDLLRPELDADLQALFDATDNPDIIMRILLIQLIRELKIANSR